jgi:hypothetical protein
MARDARRHLKGMALAGKGNREKDSREYTRIRLGKLPSRLLRVGHLDVDDNSIQSINQQRRYQRKQFECQANRLPNVALLLSSLAAFVVPSSKMADPRLLCAFILCLYLSFLAATLVDRSFHSITF